MRVSLTSVTFFVSLLAIGCVLKTTNRGQRLIPPSLNVDTQVRLERRTRAGGPENWDRAALFFNSSFRHQNEAALEIGPDADVDALLVVGQTAEFTPGTSVGSLENFVPSLAERATDRIRPQQIKEDQIWQLHRVSRDRIFDMVFHVDKIEPGYVTLTYRVTRYTDLEKFK